MSVAFVPHTAGAQRAGLVVVVGLHALIGTALLVGLARTAMEPKPPIVDVKPLDPIKKTLPDPPAPLPPPTGAARPVTPIPVPPDPIVDPVQRDAVVTTSREPATNAEPSGGDPSGIAQPAPLSQPVPRAASRPVIYNVQACAPTGDDYPVISRRAEAAGTTRIRFTVSAAGALVGSEIVRSAGPSREHKLLDRVAQSKLAGCSFGAGVDENGRAIGGTFEVDYVWKLDN